jgi:hypothetical protein
MIILPFIILFLVIYARWLLIMSFFRGIILSDNYCYSRPFGLLNFKISVCIGMLIRFVFESKEDICSTFFKCGDKKPIIDFEINCSVLS